MKMKNCLTNTLLLRVFVVCCSVGKTSHMNGLTTGRGNFELHPLLVVLRGWWIDSCKMINNEKEVIVEINDDYFDVINSHNKYINSFDDLIDSPLTLPIYDHFIISTECQHIHGIITNYKHNILKEKLTLYIDIENSSPLMFFNEAKFKIDKMNLFKLSSNNNDNNKRRRLSSLGFKETIDLPIDTINNEEFPIIYYNKETKKTYDFGDCWVTMQPYASATIGFSLDYTLKFKLFSIKARLNSISATLGFSVGIYSDLTCNFGEDNDDGKVDVELFSKTIEFGKYSATVGPIVLTMKPFVDIGAVLTRPAMAITVGAYGNIDATISGTGGWSRSDGALGFVDKSLTWDFGFHKPEYPGSDGRLGAEFAITVAPGLSFGLYNSDILYVSIPLELPYIHSEVSFNADSSECDSSSDKYELNFDIDVGLSITFEVGVEKIKIWGFTIFDGMSWTPDEALYSLSLWYHSESVDLNNPDPCTDIDDIDSSTLFSPDYYLHYYNDYPYVYVTATGTGLDGRLTFSQANAYCSMNFGSTLATIKTQEEFDQVIQLLEDWDSVHFSFPFIGLYDDDNDGVYNWIKDDSQYDETWEFTDFGGIDRQCVGVDPSAVNVDKLLITACHERVDFICDLNDITKENDRFIGIYTYSTDYTWYEANEYCYEKYGTELATIITQEQNDNAYETIYNINNNQLSTPRIWRAWIGINNILDSNNFDFQDGRNSNTTGYTNWGNNNPNGSPYTECGEFWFQSTSDKMWRDLACDNTNVASRAFVCNRANFYDVYEYENFIGVEAEIWSVTWDEANTFCSEEFGTTLASIHSSDEQEEIEHIMDSFGWDNNNYKPWIGFHDTSSEGNFVWNDGTATTYTNWRSGEPNDWSTGEDCTGVMGHRNYQWNDMPCDITFPSFICNRHKSVQQYNNFIGINTHSDNKKYNWEEANNYCSTHYQTTLASIHSSNEMNDIKYIYDLIDGDNTWIGINDKDNEGTFVWVDGSNVDYTHWATNEPSNQDCGQIGNTNSNQEWDTVSCDNNEYTSFICNRPITTVETTDFIGVNLRNTDSLTWSDANNYCLNNYGTHLASILNEEQYNQSYNIFKIFDKIQIWIGLHDTNTESVFEWSDGNNIDYTKWYTNEPNSGGSGDEDCVEMRHNNFNGMWNDLSCNNKLDAFICNRPMTIYEDGFYIAHNGHNEESFTFDEANNYCNINYDSTLATGLDDNNNDNYELVLSMFNMIESLNKNARAYIGAHDRNSENTFEWIDDSGTLSNTDSHWFPGEPNDYSGNEDCVEIWSNFLGWRNGFNDINCNTRLNSFICNNKYQIFRNGDYIGVNVETQYNNNFNTQITKYDAQTYCSAHFKSYLASIHNQEENNDIVNIYNDISNTLGYSDVEIWIGLDNYQWTDSTTFNFTNWKSNEPDNANLKCGVVVNEDVEWDDKDCSDTTPAFICNV